LKKPAFVMTLMLLLTAITLASGKSPIIVESSSSLPANYDASAQNYSSIAPHLYVYPSSVTANVGQTFTISVVVFNLTNAYVPDPYSSPPGSIPLGNLLGFDVQLFWNTTIIHCFSHTVTVPFESYSTPIPPSPYAGILHSPILPVKDIVNETGNITDAADPSVRAWFAYAALSMTPFNGNGTFCTLTFKVLAKGESPIRIVNATLADSASATNPIGQSATGKWLNDPASGIFTGEAPVANFTYWFPWSIIISALILVFIIAILLAKNKRSKQRQRRLHSKSNNHPG
jgi:hypothetical protein